MGLFDAVHVLPCASVASAGPSSVQQCADLCINLSLDSSPARALQHQWPCTSTLFADALVMYDDVVYSRFLFVLTVARVWCPIQIFRTKLYPRPLQVEDARMQVCLALSVLLFLR
jgi:hypothetical protein